MMNMWTDVFGSVGKRTTGTGPGNFLIAGPSWQGTAPSDIRQTFRSSTRYAWVLGQTQANGPDDFAVVNALQAEYKLTPLSAWGKPYTPPTIVPVDSKVDVKTTPPDQVARMDAGTFFNRLAMAMKDNPPYPEDADYKLVPLMAALEKLKKLGIEPGKPFDISKVDPAIARGLAKAVKEVPIKMQEGIPKMHNVHGWIKICLPWAGTAPTTTPGPAWRTWGSAPICVKTPSIPPRTWMATASRSTAPTST
jgi:hypothetical protein